MLGVPRDQDRRRRRRRRRRASSPRTCTSTRRRYDRSERLQRELPDAIDLLTISVESGLGFDAALQQVARNTDGPLAEEFSRVLREMQIGQGRAEALRALGERTNVADLRTFVSAMVQADAFGIPIGPGAARAVRRRCGSSAVSGPRRRPSRCPVKITIPLIFCILPSLFIAVMGPAVHQHHGQLQQVSDDMTGRRTSARQAERRGTGIRPGRAARPRAAGRRTTAALVALIAIGGVWAAATARRLAAAAPGHGGHRRRGRAGRRDLRLHHPQLAGRPRRARRPAVHRRPLPRRSRAWRWPCRPSCTAIVVVAFVVLRRPRHRPGRSARSPGA